MPDLEKLYTERQAQIEKALAERQAKVELKQTADAARGLGPSSDGASASSGFISPADSYGPGRMAPVSGSVGGSISPPPFVPSIGGLLPKPLDDELWREYQFNDFTYRIVYPVALYTRPGGTTHRVLDSDGVVHCVPAPGTGNCVLRWRAKPGRHPVKF